MSLSRASLPCLKTLTQGSPCVDSGANYSAADNDAFRPQGLGQEIADMGWHGGPHNLAIGLIGCADENACNYNADVASDDGSCEYPLSTLVDCEGQCLSDLNGDGICDDGTSECGSYEEGFADGYSQGFDDGQQQELNQCGPGTYWDEDFNLCLPIQTCMGDFNEDGERGALDLLTFLTVFGEPCSN